MDIAIDVGNSRTKAGVFEAGRLLDTRTFDREDVEGIFAYTAQWHIEDAIVCASGKMNFSMDLLPLSGKVYQLSHEMPVPFEILYETPETLGRDRIACVAGAWARFPTQPSLVVDAGTCMTYDFIDQDGRYHGGNISPGTRMRYRAMHEYTAALPDVSDMDLAKFTSLPGCAGRLGKRTTEALELGGYLGALFEIEGYIRMFSAEYQEINIILTGGDAVFFEEKLKRKIFVLPDLVLLGLSGILRYQKNEYV